MSQTTNIIYEWDGMAMVPMPRFQKLCDREFVVGEQYRMDAKEQRSIASHNHFFATVAEYWQNLPETIADQWATPEHLRKWALIKCGYFNQTSHVANSKAEALRLAAFVRPLDEFAIVVVRECEVSVFTAKSQSKKAMGAAGFQKSKEAVLDYLEHLVGAKANAA